MKSENLGRASARLDGWMYFSVAQDEYEQYLEDEAAPITKPMIDELGELYYAQQRRQFASAVKTVVFCGMALEAAIFDLAAINLGDKYALEVLDKLDLRQKWLVVPRLICGMSLDEHGRGINALRTVVRARNALVHAKSAPATADPSAIKKLGEQSAQLHRDVHESFKSVILLSLELNALIGVVAGVLPPFERGTLSSHDGQQSALLTKRIERVRELHARGDA